MAVSLHLVVCFNYIENTFCSSANVMFCRCLDYSPKYDNPPC